MAVDDGGFSAADTELPDETAASDQPPRPALVELGPGELIGRYQIVDRLGAGGMGVVYRARDTELSRDVAVKLLHARVSGTGSDHEQRLLREAQALAKVSHANLVTVFDLGSFRGQVYVVMELVEGTSLKYWLREGTRDWRDVIAVFERAARGLIAAHRAGLVHRDFKPDNVLIGDDGAVQVADFGLARSVTELSSDVDARASTLPPGADDVLSTPLTRTGAVMGTPAYMSPEQHWGKTVDATADQFSFAVSLYEGLYGARPYEGTSLAEVVYAVTEGQVVAPPATSPVPRRIWLVLQRALSTEPEQRYPDMTALMEALDQATRRRWKLPAAIVATTIAIVVGAVMFISSQRDWMRLGNPGGKYAIQDVVVHHKPDVLACYEKLAGGRRGDVIIKFTIGPTGRLKRASIERDDFGDSGLGPCIASSALRWKFPAPMGGGEVTVRYPFSFSPK